MISALKKHASEFQKHLGKNITLKYTPRLQFELDESIAEGDRILAILAGMKGPPAGDNDEDQ